MINFYYLPRELSSHFWPVIVDGPFHIHFKSAAATFGMKWNQIEWNGLPVQLASMDRSGSEKKYVVYDIV